ncbi:ArsR family transcriptional regulator [Geomonas terrae]|uniref:ArsR family transcriptional regulator n=1 Tax=Geomonas terrae TaxID=2562681 RepID=A0A4S1CMK5_9BACT|nr:MULTISPECIES: ArsR family transcriptional regulator [Geomonas]TGU74853.1 ArsR family transcriptional regulator [Geomonas terrae]
MAEVKRIQIQEARRKVQDGEALFVCAYDSEEMCGGIRLEKALTMGELNARLPEVPKEKEIIFYCN